MQAVCCALGGGVAQQHLTPSWEVRQRLSEIHHLASILHLLSHIVHLRHVMGPLS